MMISIILAIAIFNESIISFGYVLIVMLLMIDLFGLSKNKDYSDKLSFKLKWILLPYLLSDVLFQLMMQIPGTPIYNSTFIKNVFGVEAAWKITPEKLNIGDDVAIEYSAAGNISPLLIKGLTFFIITVQLQILNSYEYKSYTLKWH